jgi:hypothetical protein
VEKRGYITCGKAAKIAACRHRAVIMQMAPAQKEKLEQRDTDVLFVSFAQIIFLPRAPSLSLAKEILSLCARRRRAANLAEDFQYRRSLAHRGLCQINERRFFPQTTWCARQKIQFAFRSQASDASLSLYLVILRVYENGIR